MTNLPPTTESALVPAGPSGLEWLFDASSFPPRWHCGDWSKALGWTHIISDSLIFVAYAAIPAALFFFIARRRDIPLRLIFWLFMAFILSCGLTHLTDATMFYYPMYRFLAVMKVMTAAVSLSTAFVLIRLMPSALRLPAVVRQAEDSKAELQVRRKSEEKLSEERAKLEERTSHLTVRDRRIRKAMIGANGGAVCWNVETGEILWEVGLTEAQRRPASMNHVRNWEQALDPGSFDALRQAAQRTVRTGERLIIELPFAPHESAPTRLRLRADRDPGSGESEHELVGLFVVLDRDEIKTRS